MARLPSEHYLMQEIGESVILFEDYTEREIARFDPASYLDTARALETISVAGDLDDQDKCFAYFWAGYFFSYFASDAETEHPFITETADGRVQVLQNGWTEVVKFDPSDANASAQAQKSIYDSGLSPVEKIGAHFWSGYFYGRAVA